MSGTGALERAIGVPGAILLGLGSMVGTGVFVSIFVAGGVAGPAVVLSIAVAACVAAANALSSAQLAAAHPVSGGTYEYGYRFLRPVLGFNAGWMFLLAKSASAATAALAFATYAWALFTAPARFSEAAPSPAAARGPVSQVDAAGAGAPEWLLASIAVGIVILVTAVVLAGLRRTSMVNGVIVSVTIGSLLLFSAFAIPRWDAALLSPFFAPAAGRSPLRATLYAAALSFVAFTGYGRIATLGEEIRNPTRNIPRAIALTVALVTALYMVVALAAAGTAGTHDLAAIVDAGGAPLEATAEALAGPGGRVILAVGAMVATVGVLLNLILGLSRVLLAMGRRGDMPRVFGRVRRGAPTPAILMTAGAVGALALIGDVRVTWSFSAITVLIYYATANAAALAVPTEVRIYPRWISWFGLFGCVALAAFVDPAVLGTGALAVGAGLLWFAARRAGWSRGGGAGA